MSQRALWTSVVTAAGFFCLLSPASAAEDSNGLKIIQPAIFEIAQGHGGKTTKNGGTHEQGVVTAFEKDGKQYVVTVYMSPDTDMPYWQCKCSSFELTEKGPKVVADNVQISFNEGGMRNCNRPAIAHDGQNVVWTYGSDYMDPNTTYIYAGVLDEQCGKVVPEMQISTTNNNDNGGTSMVFNGAVDGVSRFVATSFENGNGGIAWAYGLSLHYDEETGEPVFKRTFEKKAYTGTNIARQKVAPIDNDRTLYCGPDGNQRPPERGVVCVVLDKTGNVIPGSRMTIAKTDKTQDIYYNQPTIAVLDYNRFAIQVLRSNGEGRKDNGKGSNNAELYIYEVSEDSQLILKSQMTDIETTFQTHSSICSGQYGAPGSSGQHATSIAMIAAPPTGVGQGMMQMLNWSPETDFMIDSRDEWVISEYADSGHQSNMYGANPNNQGRDFMNCIGNVPNPGYGVEDGFMPTVKTLFVAPMSGKKPDQAKNAQFLSFIPGASDAPLTTPADGPSDGSDPNGNGAELLAPDALTEQAGACSVASPGPSSNNDWAGLGLLALGMFIGRRRRA